MGKRTYLQYCLLLLLLLPGCMHMGNPYSPEKVIIPSDNHVVPLRFDGWPYIVDVMVNGTGPYPFILDTGCDSVLLSEELASALGLRTKPPRESLHTEWDSFRQYSRADVASIGLGDIEFRNTQVRVVPSQAFAGSPASGIVGFALFWDEVWTFDGPGKRIIFGSGSAACGAEDSTRSLLPMVLSSRCPYVSMYIRRRDQVTEDRLDVLIDTGKASYPNLDLPISMQTRPIPLRVVVGTATGQKEMEVGSVQSVRIGAMLLPRTVVGFAPNLRDRWSMRKRAGLWLPVVTDKRRGVVGLGILRECAITFDRPGGRVWIGRTSCACPEGEGPQP